MEDYDIMATLTWATGGATVTTATVFTEVTGTFGFNNDDVRALYVDWGDGTDPDGNFTNKKEYANYQWYETTTPTGSIVLTHTYTAEKAAGFKPIVQTVNSKGFFSQYTASGTSNTEITPYFQTKATMTPLVVNDGTATGVMRTQNKTVNSGIDNSIFDVEGAKDLFVMVVPTLNTSELAYFCETGAASTNSVNIDIKCILNYGIRDGDGAANTVQTDTGGERTIKTIPLVLSGANLTGSVTGLRNVLASGAHNLGALESGAQVAQVLEVKYKNPKYVGSNTEAYTQNEVYNRFKIFLAAYSDNLGKYIPVTYITPGDPIKKATDPLRNVTLDFSQSRAKASNVSLKTYRYDSGKSWFQSANRWGTGSATTFNDATSGTSSNKDVAYTYMPRPDGLLGSATYTLFSTAATSTWDTNAASVSIEDQVVLDDYGRFPNQYHLSRVSVEPSSSASYVSSITTNKPNVFRITPAISWAVTSDGSTAASAANARIYPTKILDSGTNASMSKDYTDAAFNNVSGTSGLVSLSGMNAMTFYDVSNTARANAAEYVLCMFDKKTNKVFLNMSNYSDNMASTLGTDPAWDIAGVYYLSVENKGSPTQNAIWKPLEFNDTTQIIKEYRDTTNDTYTTLRAPLSKSGYISFDTPLDWENISLTNACGGVYNSTTLPASATDMDYAVATGSVTASGAGSTIGDWKEFTMTSNPISALATDSDIGSFKYIFIPSDGTSLVSGAYWVTKDGADGYDSANDKIYFNLGDSGTTTGAGITKGYIRRVNIYDILDGFSKVYMPVGGSATELYNVGDVGNWSTPWDNTYNIKSDNTIGPLLSGAWLTDEKYLLKIALAGTDAASTNIFPEIWNVFDGNEGFESIIKEVDNSAYNLNSLPITSDISVGRGGSYFSAITRKGKVFIARTGDSLESIGFSSVALGDSSTFDTYSDPSSLYGHLRKIRGLHVNTVRVYWDEVQKDGTYVRYWGVITEVNETHGTGGPRSVVNYDFNMIVEGIALLDSTGTLMTDIIPLGGIGDEKHFT